MNILKILTQYIYCLSYFELALFVAAASVICAAVNSFLYKYSWWRYILIAIGTAYTMLLLYITLLGRTKPIVNSISLVPFESYIGYLNGVQEMLRTCIMNIFLFYPLGLVLGALLTKQKLWKLLLAWAACFGLSVMIELSQYIFSIGYAEVDDVINNTIGSALGISVMRAGTALVLYIKEKLHKITAINNLKD